MPAASFTAGAAAALRPRLLLLLGAGALGSWADTGDIASDVAAALDDECAVGDEACALNALQMRARKFATAANTSEAGDGSCLLYGCYGFIAGRPCQCNSKCEGYGNCCHDFSQMCHFLFHNNHHSHAECYASNKVYSLNWEAKGATFFDNFTFVTQDDVHGAHQFTEKDEAWKHGVISTKHGQAQLKYGGLRTPSYAGEAYKRYAANIHTNQAWDPSPGFLAVLHYTHLPHGCGIWPSFWAMNSDAVWPKGGELDIMEFANGEANKVTFHISDKCSLDFEKGRKCAPPGHTRYHAEECETSYFNPTKAKLGCMPYQKQPKGADLAARPGIIAAEWTEDHIVVFHIPEAEIPADLRNDQPRPETWRRWTMAYIPFKPGCSIGPQELVLNMQLCGDWAGATWGKTCANTGLWKGHGCVTGLSQPTDCCTKYVTSPLRETQYRYQSDWDIKNLKVYTPQGESSKKSGTFLRNGAPLTA